MTFGLIDAGLMVAVAMLVGAGLMWWLRSGIDARPSRPHPVDPASASRMSVSAMQVLIDAIPAIINCKDRDSRYVLMNSYQAALYGTTPSAAIGRTAAEILGAEYGAYTSALDREVIASGLAVGPIEEQYPDANGHNRAWLTSKTPIKDAHGAVTHVVTVAFDIAERKRVEEMLVQARNESEAASRAKATFLAIMSHELRTPLNAIIGFSEMIKENIHGATGSPKYTEYAGNVVDSGRFLLSIINDILDLSKIEAGQVTLSEETLNLGALLERCRKFVETRAQQDGIQVVLEVTPPQLEVYADRRLLMQIVINLLTNAVKFSPAGGRVLVQAAIAPGGYLDIKVEDHGVGMSEDEIAIALKPFEQVDRDHARKHEGSGLGLPIVQGLVTIHGGTLVIESESGVGTNVTVRLPPERLRPAGSDADRQLVVAG